MSAFPELPPLPALDFDIKPDAVPGGFEVKPEIARMPAPGGAEEETAAVVRAAALKRGTGDAAPTHDADPEVARHCRERRAMARARDMRPEVDADPDVAQAIRTRMALRGAPESGAPESGGHDESVEMSVRAKMVGRNVGQGSGDGVDEDTAHRIKAGLALSGLQGRNAVNPDRR